jgi:hypothetical protein
VRTGCPSASRRELSIAYTSFNDGGLTSLAIGLLASATSLLLALLVFPLVARCPRGAWLNRCDARSRRDDYG